MHPSNPVLLSRRVKPTVAATAATTWNASDNGGLTLTNSNLTATGTGTIKSVRANNAIVAASYFEVDVTIATNEAVGIANSTFSLTTATMLGSDSSGGGLGDSVGSQSRRAVLKGGGTLFTITGAYTNVTIGVAVDPSAKKIWLRSINTDDGTWDGTWNADVIGNQNPVGGVGGVSYSDFNGGAATVYPAVSAGTSGDILIGRFTGTYKAAAPSGYGNV